MRARSTLFWHATDTYDLGNFPRQMLKFKIGMEF